ncbi:DUF1405 domain-containing protein [Staphylococcus argensis]|uniref:DUF1405 domain-containing protein n=1 Tax=Staphylococcus argensis TaxID=1607738 RepID=A0A2K4FFB3_9STAP|nr:DUF1405 domain-containing protein [Staphylococcus argensis]MCY6990487.1 DUF1405 domain-containing protein [Staphylococcus argensis]POA09997.1 DUF1405 domain-containing protein [Staphylococcus argensis]
MVYQTIWFHLLYSKRMLWLLFICNLAGTIYGYIWYKDQLAHAPWLFKAFVPDSPTATLFLTIILGLYLLGKRSTIFEALAFTSLFKYGVWAVVINLILMISYDMWTITGMLLMLSHGIMALEAILFSPRMRLSWMGLIIAIVWLFHNDVIDYVFLQYPVYPFIASHLNLIAYFTFWLSVSAIILYIVMTRHVGEQLVDRFKGSQ